MENNKMTSKKALVYVVENCELPDEIREKLQKMLESLDKKNGNKKDSAKKEENEKLKESIVDLIAQTTDENGLSATTILKLLNNENLTVQKITALLTQLKDEGKVKRNVVKGKSMFKIA
jgi:predicted Rossmann fold nucleotide-binding protein DprA/Smf involved in DNA uptake